MRNACRARERTRAQGNSGSFVFPHPRHRRTVRPPSRSLSFFDPIFSAHQADTPSKIRPPSHMTAPNSMRGSNSVAPTPSAGMPPPAHITKATAPNTPPNPHNQNRMSRMRREALNAGRSRARRTHVIMSHRGWHSLRADGDTGRTSPRVRAAAAHIAECHRRGLEGRVGHGQQTVHRADSLPGVASMCSEKKG